jgi:anaerobic ribonucleoside-triphosphate reductase
MTQQCLEGKTVAIPANTTASRQIYHTSGTCGKLTQADARTVSLSALDERWTECKRCSGEHGRLQDEPERRCPKCNREYSNLPQHMRACTGGFD